MPYARGLGYGALAAAPILLAALAVIASRPAAPASLVTHAAIAAWIAGTLAFAASMIHRRGGVRAARSVGGLAVLVVVGFTAFLGWTASVLHTRIAVLDERERAELSTDAGRLTHPSLRLSFAALPEGMQPAQAIREESERAGGRAWADAHRIWAFEGNGAEAVIDLSRAPRADGETLREALDELEGQLGRTSRNVQRVDQAGLSGAFEAGVAEGGTVLARVALFARGDRAYRLVVTVVTRDPVPWRRWLDGMRVG